MDATYTGTQMLAVLIVSFAAMFALAAYAVRRIIKVERELTWLSQKKADLEAALQRSRDDAAKYAKLKRDMLIVRSYPRESMAQFRAYQEVIDDLEKQRDN